jgi:hypothetical protein
VREKEKKRMPTPPQKNTNQDVTMVSFSVIVGPASAVGAVLAAASAIEKVWWRAGRKGGLERVG